MENGSVVNFDLSLEAPTNYFKSSFARSMALTNTSQSKSLDYVYLDDGATISEESEPDIMSKMQTSTPRKPRRSVPTLPTYDPAFPKDYSFRRNRNNDAIKFWKMKQESAMKQADSSWLNNDHTLVQEESKEEEILRLRKECQGLMEQNRKLQAGNASIDTSLLQSQIDTLQWQLKQAESNRQMYRAVMEQVSKFLERVQKALDASPTKGSPRGKSRVPRSRSVHTVVTSQSRASSPSPSHGANVHRANSITQMQDSYATLRDYTCRRGSRTVVEEISTERLSQDAFRLLRTIQSLLGTREPDLARVSDQAQRRDSTSMGSCSSLVVASVTGCETVESDGKSSTGSTSSASGVTPSGTINGTGIITPQPSVSGSTEDESGFSSMSSFHEVTTSSSTSSSTLSTNGTTTHSSSSSTLNAGTNSSIGGGSNSTTTAASVPPTTTGLATISGSPHELGLPLVSPEHQSSRHRRWSSTPVEAGYSQPLRVLWRSQERREVPKFTFQDLTNLC